MPDITRKNGVILPTRMSTASWLGITTPRGLSPSIFWNGGHRAEWGHTWSWRRLFRDADMDQLILLMRRWMISSLNYRPRCSSYHKPSSLLCAPSLHAQRITLFSTMMNLHSFWAGRIWMDTTRSFEPCFLRGMSSWGRSWSALWQHFWATNSKCMITSNADMFTVSEHVCSVE